MYFVYFVYFVFNVNFEHVFAYCHCTKNELSITRFFSNRRSHRRCSVRKRVLRNFAKAQVFSCEFCEISKNTLFTEHVRATASLVRKRKIFSHLLKKSLMENLCVIYVIKWLCAIKNIRKYFIETTLSSKLIRSSKFSRSDGISEKNGEKRRKHVFFYQKGNVWLTTNLT